MNNSTTAQRNAILNHLREHGFITTIQARDELGIMSPAARVQELRDQGYPIVTEWTCTIDRTGTKHREAKYVLFTNDGNMPRTTSDQTNERGENHHNHAGASGQISPDS